jgi:hypothetical protein
MRLFWLSLQKLAKGWCKTLGVTTGLPRVAEEEMWRISSQGADWFCEFPEKK